MDFLMAPAEWLGEKLWRLHRKEPTWWRVISATLLSILTLAIFLTWFVLLIGVVVGIVWLALQVI